MAHFVDGRATSSSAPTPMCPPPTTASCRAAPPTMTDVGMCGDYDSIIGMAKEEPLRRFLTENARPGRRVRPGRRHLLAASPSTSTTAPASPDAVSPLQLGQTRRRAAPQFWT